MDWSRRSPTSDPCSRSPAPKKSGPSRRRASEGHALEVFFCGPGEAGAEGGDEMSSGRWARCGDRALLCARARLVQGPTTTRAERRRRSRRQGRSGQAGSGLPHQRLT
jgi:hypothetical protein